MSIISWIKSIFAKKKSETNEHCEECDAELFTCSICGCKYDIEEDALRCSDYDYIMRHSNHRNHHMHKRGNKE